MQSIRVHAEPGLVYQAQLTMFALLYSLSVCFLLHWSNHVLVSAALKCCHIWGHQPGAQPTQNAVRQAIEITQLLRWFSVGKSPSLLQDKHNGNLAFNVALRFSFR